jgi:hypothetical protein
MGIINKHIWAVTGILALMTIMVAADEEVRNIISKLVIIH